MSHRDNWPLIVEEHRHRVFHNTVLRKVTGPRRDEVTGTGENYTIRSFMICTPHQVLPD
jgi:hypothetical protein